MKTMTTDYWTPRRMEIWRNMTPAERDYDRYVGVYPPGQDAYEIDPGWKRLVDDMRDESGCRCHINPPCSYCVSLDDTEAVTATELVSTSESDDWCNCQAIFCTPGYPGPWHPVGNSGGVCTHPSMTANGGAK